MNVFFWNLLLVFFVWVAAQKTHSPRDCMRLSLIRSSKIWPYGPRPLVVSFAPSVNWSSSVSLQLEDDLKHPKKPTATKFIYISDKAFPRRTSTAGERCTVLSWTNQAKWVFLAIPDYGDGLGYKWGLATTFLNKQVFFTQNNNDCGSSRQLMIVCHHRACTCVF